jgi:hypothetical protein
MEKEVTEVFLGGYLLCDLPDLLGPAVIFLGEWNHSFFRPTATARKPSYS